MTWICPVCSEELGNYNAYCEYCKHSNSIIYNPDRYYIREIRIYHIQKDIQMSEEKGLSGEELLDSIESNERMTPQEKLFAKLFYHETMLVKDMDTLTLRAHIEDLSKIAFEARARHGAATTEDGRRKNKDNKPKGFERSLNTDETTTNAINTIKDRQKRLTKQEKIQAGLEKLGISSTHAVELLQAGTILVRLKNKTPEEIEAMRPKIGEPVFNPFEKKE